MKWCLNQIDLHKEKALKLEKELKEKEENFFNNNNDLDTISTFYIN